MRLRGALYLRYMRLVAVKRVRPGTILARSVYTANKMTVPLLGAGVEITEDFKQGLIRMGIPSVWIEDEISEGIEIVEALGQEAAQEALITIQHAFDESNLAAETGHALPDHVVKEMKGVAFRIAEEIMKNGDVAVWLRDLAEADQYTVRHSLDTCVVGLLIGKKLMYKHGWLDHRQNQRYDSVEERLSRLGLGLLLHDIGKLQLPTDILHKAELTDDERELYRRHPLMGAEILKGDHISALVRAVVRWHHENWDGSGYPHGLQGDAIAEMARICSVANIFDAVTSERPGVPAMPLDIGVERILMGAGTEFDPRVVEVFRSVVAPYPVGTEVQLSDGRRALVIEVFDDNFARPIIRVIEDIDGEPLPPIDIDLRDAPEIAIIGTV